MKIRTYLLLVLLLSLVFSLAESQTITTFSPNSGPVASSVTISGSGFIGATRVLFNTTAAVFQVVTSSSIRATVPAGATTGPISVISPTRTARSSGFFTVTSTGGSITITGFSPTSGPVASRVGISGTNFVGATRVLFNGVASVFSVVTSTSINATVPAGAISGPITVVAPAGTVRSTAFFTVTGTGGSITITTFSPLSGVPGTRVSINGTNFVGATRVLFNGVASTSFQVVTSNLITATVPAAATSGRITIVAPAGTVVSGAIFTVNPLRSL